MTFFLLKSFSNKKSEGSRIMKTAMINFLRKIVPRKIQTLVRFYQIFNNIYGHSNIVDGIIKSGDGKALPWITYSAIEFLNTLDLKDCDVFEFGSGSSTLFWASKVRSVTSVEKDSKWYNRIKKKLPPNCDLHLYQKDLEYINFIKVLDKKYDIIVIDGAVRFPCTEMAIQYLNKNGILVVDNSEWYPNSCALLRKKGFIQIDFSGFTPLNAFPSATSIFYKAPELLLKKNTLQPMGSRKIRAYDDMSFEQIDKQFILK